MCCADLSTGSWAPRNVRNWIYVVLSRVKSLDQLFLLSPLPEDRQDAPDERLVDMMYKIRFLHPSGDKDRIRVLRERIEKRFKVYRFLKKRIKHWLKANNV